MKHYRKDVSRQLWNSQLKQVRIESERRWFILQKQPTCRFNDLFLRMNINNTKNTHSNKQQQYNRQQQQPYKTIHTKAYNIIQVQKNIQYNTYNAIHTTYNTYNAIHTTYNTYNAIHTTYNTLQNIQKTYNTLQSIQKHTIHYNTYKNIQYNTHSAKNMK